jgi:hypothetical protein
MSASVLLPRRLRNGFATACLILAQLSGAACGRDRSNTPGATQTRSFLPTTSADSLLGPDALAIYAVMNDQVSRLRSSSLDYWALLDSLGKGSVEERSSSRGTLAIAFVRFAGRAPAGLLERTTKESSEGPTTVKDATVESRSKVTVWDEGGKLGMLTELHATATRTTEGTTVRVTHDRTERTEVKFCPDAQGVAPGSWEFVEAKEVTATGPKGIQTSRAEFRATAGLTGQVDDEAELSHVQEKMAVKTGQSSGSASRKMTPVIGSTTDGTGNRIPTGIESWETGEQQQVKATSDDTRLRLQAAAIVAEISGGAAYKKARDRWRGHRCVEVAFLEGNMRRSVSPGDRVRIVAEARHKQEGGKLPAPLEADPVAYQSITPEKKRIPPPAEFTYQAPKKGTEEAAYMREKGTTVYVTSTSRRGIGLGVIEYRLSSGPSFAIRIHRKSVSEKLGTVSDVSYHANLTPNEDGGLNGTGTYSGKVVTWQSACPGDPKPKTHAVAGSLKANGNVVSFGSKSLIMYMLETTDWPLMADGPPAETAEEREEFKTTGSVGNPLGLTLKGPVTTKVDKSTGSMLETDCTGGFENTVETTVELIK